MIQLTGMGCVSMAEHTDKAEYIGQTTAVLAKMAREDGLILLAFILDMATLEARQQADRLTDEPIRAARE
jgi:hypothetical protein